MDNEKCLVFNRRIWELGSKHLFKDGFTKEELDKAEKSKDGLIGRRDGVKCYMSTNLKANQQS